MMDCEQEFVSFEVFVLFRIEGVIQMRRFWVDVEEVVVGQLLDVDIGSQGGVFQGSGFVWMEMILVGGGQIFVGDIFRRLDFFECQLGFWNRWFLRFFQWWNCLVLREIIVVLVVSLYLFVAGSRIFLRMVYIVYRE